ncbi:hypothetical protein [Sporosarcina sp. Marseille-Q4943]|uniref:hypothetical protein n=1 Tax=Sporosarcina sp. Marseille-Q4943 TaxID=2942204 RepID=UPI00208DB6C4|nr:hypothetical protein [Sporosarcina sp. Marseille-Q4943]
MKKFLVITFVTLLFLSGCNTSRANDSSIPIELAAFNSLTNEEKALIPASPKDSVVKKIAVNDEIKHLIDKDYDKDEIYSITFNNTETESLGKLIVFVDLDKETVVGKGFSNQ